ncbi:MAG: hypothetical protein LBE91_13865 [Tannerella sp.]|jgi:hypothetical protein|nr:hypothetical protein [Tannerella sp.]
MKKIFKWIGIVFASLLAIALIAVGIFIVRNKMYIGLPDKKTVEYLNKNKIVLNQNAFEKDAPLFDNEAYTSDIILLGESHGVADVQSIDKELFLHLNKKIGLRYYVAEMDSIRANQLNIFLNGTYKDTLLLKKFVIEIGKRIPQQSSIELYQKWADIYDYNRNLPDSLKLRVIGIDADFDKKSPISRDSAMIQNFKNIVKSERLERKQFYGLFGLFHVSQNEFKGNNNKPFAARLKADEFNVTSILCLYVDCEVYMPPNEQFPTPPSQKISFLNMDGPIVLLKGINDFKKASQKGEATLFNLRTTNSPYFESKIAMKTNFINQAMESKNEQLPIVDFFQYAILVRNSTALTPIK